MNPTELARAFKEGKFIGPKGPLVPRRAMLTRRSLLLFTDQMVVKLKRPRVVDGVDQTDMRERYAMVARERWVGEQLNAEVYLDDFVLRVDDDHVTMVRGYVEGEPIVLSRRLPDAQHAEALLAANADDDLRRGLEQAVVRLARFHAKSEMFTSGPLANERRPVQRFEQALERIREHLEPAQHEQLARETAEWATQLLPTFQHRIIERRVRLLHGAVRLEHIFVKGPGLPEAAIIDGSDAPDHERANDIAEDIMGLAIEIDAALGVDIGARVVDAYAAETTDASLRKVARFYKRLACMMRAGEAWNDAADGDASAEQRARFFVRRALS